MISESADIFDTYKTWKDTITRHCLAIKAKTPLQIKFTRFPKFPRVVKYLQTFNHDIFSFVANKTCYITRQQTVKFSLVPKNNLF